jgi:glucose-6-phosphate 1-dehydrogenase
MPKSLTLAVLGATGDLFKSKLSVALCNLFLTGKLPPNFSLIAFARKDYSDESFRSFVKESLLKSFPDKENDIDTFLATLRYIQGDIENPDEYNKLGAFDMCYIATPPALYKSILSNIASVTQGFKPRILIEKPFGENSKMAQELTDLIEKNFDESQIYRVDHYLHKPGLRQITEFNLDPKDFKTLSVTLYESDATDLVGKRGAFYDKIGAFLDMGQNHLLAVLASVAADAVTPLARAKVLESLKVIPDHAVRAQYEGYREEPGVNPNSQTETFFRVGFKDSTAKTTFELQAGKGLLYARQTVEGSVHGGGMFGCDLTFPRDDAYEQVFIKAISGDQSLFVSTREVVAQWRLADEVKAVLGNTPLISYKVGTDPEQII